MRRNYGCAEVPTVHAPETMRFARGFFCAAGLWRHRTDAAAIVAGASTPYISYNRCV